MNKRLKVLHILWSGRIGGTEEYIINLVKKLNHNRYEIVLCFLKEKGEIFDEISKYKGFKVDYIGIRNGRDILGALRFGLYLIRNRFDIIHSHTRNILSTGVLAISAFTTPKIFTHHISPGDVRSSTKIKIFYGLYSGLFSKVLTISKAVKESLINNFGYSHAERVEVVYNGVDTTRFSPDVKPSIELQNIKSRGVRIIGFIGRMEYFKRPILFVKIAIEIIKTGEDYHFVMVGDGPELERCKEMVLKNDLGDSFTFLGYRRDIPQILRSLDGLIFTSKGEGFGVVITEAMAAGVPVFAINDGAVPEIIKHRENGILFNTTEPGDIAKEIVEIFNDNELINKIKLNASTDVKGKFSIERAARETERIYEEIMGRAQDG